MGFRFFVGWFVFRWRGRLIPRSGKNVGVEEVTLLDLALCQGPCWKLTGSRAKSKHSDGLMTRKLCDLVEVS